MLGSSNAPAVICDRRRAWGVSVLRGCDMANIKRFNIIDALVDIKIEIRKLREDIDLIKRRVGIPVDREVETPSSALKVITGGKEMQSG